MGGQGRIEVIAMAVIAEGVQADQFAHLPASARPEDASTGVHRVSARACARVRVL
jgi:hypothetical protein